jgi:hypothetical protein
LIGEVNYFNFNVINHYYINLINDFIENYSTINCLDISHILYQKSSDINSPRCTTAYINKVSELKWILEKRKNYFDKYNKLKFKFSNSGLKIYFSNRFIFPNNYSNDLNFSATKQNKEVLYDLKKLENFNFTFFMTIHSTENRIDNSVVNLDLCDEDKKCLRSDFYLKFSALKCD